MNQIKEIAKSIYDAIQVRIEEDTCYKFLNFAFKDGEFISYFFTDDIFDSSDDTVYGGLTFDEYTNMSIEDIEGELLYTQKESM